LSRGVRGCLDKLVEGTRIHVLHAVVDTGFDEESTIEIDDLRGNGAMEDIELHYYGVQLGLIKL